MSTVLHLVRHGESEWNAERRVQGQTMHVGLTQLGRQQAHDVGDVLTDYPITAVLSSDQARAMQTAEIIADLLGMSPRSEPRLREMSLGALEGLSIEEAVRRTDGADWTDPDGHPEGGESVRDVHTRITDLARELCRDNGEYVLVSHGDAIRIALAALAGLPPESVGHTVPANGSITTVTVSAR
jgi:broad specificity phosphatase PhoE